MSSYSESQQSSYSESQQSPRDRLNQGYLQNFSDLPKDFNCDQLPTFSEVVVVPARNEGSFFFDKTLPSLKKASQKIFEQTGIPVLICIVANGRTSDCEIEVSQQISFLKKFSFESQISNFLIAEKSESFFVGVFDFISENFRFGPKDGVGLARKIGCDLAVLLAQKHKLGSKFIYTTDSDAEVPENYFSSDKSQLKNGGIAILPFKHVPDLAQSTPAIFGEIFDDYLLNYRRGLQFAESPFAFTALGSALCMNLQTYVQVRGMPKLLAGEDFYICNKIAKFSRVYHFEGEPILLQSRLSDRVPFGTGARLTKWKTFTDLNPANEIVFENPRCFVELKKTRKLFKDLRTFLYDFSKIKKADIHPGVIDFIEKEKIFSRLKKGIQKNPTETLLEKIEKEIFDGLAEIRLINTLSQIDDLKPLPYKEALKLGDEQWNQGVIELIQARIVSAWPSGIKEPVGGILETPGPPMMR